MPSLQVRELPDHIYQKLVQEAEREHRSLSQQAIAVLARGFGVAMNPKERRRKLFEEIRNSPIKLTGKRIQTSAEMIREDRDR